MTLRLLLLLSLILPLAGCGWGRPEPIVINFPRRHVLIAGQIGMVLQKTDILERNGLRAEFFTPQRNPTEEDLSQQRIDVILSGEADPLNRVDAGSAGRIVARLGSGGRMGIVTRNNTGIRSVGDLRGRKLALVTGNALHRWVAGELTAAGVPEEELTLEPYFNWESVNDERIDAIVLWDPSLLAAERFHQVTTLATTEYQLGVFFSQEFIDTRREDAVSLLVALQQAALYMALNPLQVNQWWSEPKGRPMPDLVDACSRANHLYRAKQLDEIDLDPNNPEYRAALEADARFMVSRGVLSKEPDLDSLIDPSLLQEARARSTPFDPSAVKVP